MTDQEKREKVRQEILKAVCIEYWLGKSYCPFINTDTCPEEDCPDIKRRIDKILAIPELAIVDREAKLPGVGIKPDSICYYRCHIEEQNNMALVQGWVKEIDKA